MRPAGGFQCGELLLARSMPAFRSLGRERTLTLVYNSAAARPYPVVMTEVSLPPQIAVPDSLRVTLGIPGTSASWTYLYANTGFASAGPARRLAIGFDAAAPGLTTGVHALRCIEPRGTDHPSVHAYRGIALRRRRRRRDGQHCRRTRHFASLGTPSFAHRGLTKRL